MRVGTRFTIGHKIEMVQIYRDTNKKLSSVSFGLKRISSSYLQTKNNISFGLYGSRITFGIINCEDTRDSSDTR